MLSNNDIVINIGLKLQIMKVKLKDFFAFFPLDRLSPPSPSCEQSRSIKGRDLWGCSEAPWGASLVCSSFLCIPNQLLIFVSFAVNDYFHKYAKICFLWANPSTVTTGPGGEARHTYSWHCEFQNEPLEGQVLGEEAALVDLPRGLLIALLCAQQGEIFSSSHFTSSSPLPFCFSLSHLFFPSVLFPFAFSIIYLFPFRFPFPFSFPFMLVNSTSAEPLAMPALLEGLIQVLHTQMLLCQGLAFLACKKIAISPMWYPRMKF